MNELDFGEKTAIPKAIQFKPKDKIKDKIETKPKSKSKPNPTIKAHSITYYLFINAHNYSVRTWQQCFPDKTVCLRSLIFNPGWFDFFDIIEKKSYYPLMEEILSKFLSKNQIVPHAELVFNALNVLSPRQIQAVIIGQDPYVSSAKINGQTIPEAMGLSFSVPLNFPKPPSLSNIYQNLVDFGHAPKIPQSGCLTPWVLQGCFMINASLTTFLGSKNSHQNVWKYFSQDLLSYINSKCENVVFLVWGKNAHMSCLNIDTTKHCIITSSHPSPLAVDKTLRGIDYKKKSVATYPSFKSVNHFGLTNSYLKSKGKKEIFWDLID